MNTSLYAGYIASLLLAVLLTPTLTLAQVTISYTYDELDRLQTVARSDGPQTSFNLDVIGNITSTAVTQSPDTDNDQLADFADPDDDNDGMPDTWELQFNFDPLDASDGSQDPDNDGRTNLQEFNDMTNPLVDDSPSVTVPTIPFWAMIFLSLALLSIVRVKPLIQLSIISLYTTLAFSTNDRAYAVTDPGWSWESVASVSHEEAKLVLGEPEQVLASSLKNLSTIAASNSALALPSDYSQLAESLQNDPLRIYQYVRNNFEYVPYYGSLKGPYLTLHERSGNDFDQAALLIEILRAAGFTAKFRYGIANISIVNTTQLLNVASWLGTEPDATIINKILSSGGIPHSLEGTTLEFDRVWVEVTIDAAIVSMDPAFKLTTQSTTVNLDTATGYNETDLLTAAGGTLGTNSIENIDEPGLASHLTTLTTNLNTYLLANHATDGIEKILGGYAIVPDKSDALPTTLPLPMSPSQIAWTSIPDNYVHTINIQHSDINKTIDIPLLAGRKLSIEYSDEVIPPATENLGNVEVGQLGSAVNSTTIGNESPAPMTVEVFLADDPTSAFEVTVDGQSLSQGQPLAFTIPANSDIPVTYRLNGVNQTEGRKYASIIIESKISQFGVSAAGRISLTGIVGKNAENYEAPSANNLGTVDSGELGELLIHDPLTNSSFAPMTVDVYLTSTTPSAFEVTVNNQSISWTAPISFTVPENGEVPISFRLNGNSQPEGRKFASLIFVVRVPQFGASSAFNIPLHGVVGELDAKLEGRALIYLNDELLDFENQISTENENLILSIDHPYAANNGTLFDQSVTFDLKRDSTYVLASGFGGDKNSTLLAERQRLLNRMSLNGATPNSRQAVTETLNIIGQTWMKQSQLYQDMLASISNNRSVRHHRFGIAGQEESYFVDIAAQKIALTSRDNGVDNGLFEANSLVASALEHSVLEQLQGESNPAISTTKIFSLNNQNGDKLFLANSSNYSTIESQLTNYSSADLATLQARIDDEFTLIVPENGTVNLNDWSGEGYIQYRSSSGGASIGMIIDGDLNGGFGSIEQQLNPEVTASEAFPEIIPPSNIATPRSKDPVDLASGAFLSTMTDLTLGSSGSRGLSFTRSYNSQQVAQNVAGLGHGWNHNYNIYLSEHSNSLPALGQRAPRDAAPLIVAAHVTQSLLNSIQPSLQQWAVSSLVANWAVEQILKKTITVHSGDRSIAFRELPDGSYVAPPGVTANLLKLSDNTFELHERFGTVLKFNSDNQIESLTDIDGNALTFSYTNDKLTQATDAFNRSLTLTYSGENLTSVSDSTGRSASYTITDNNLTTVTGLENAQWQYSYDNIHRLETVINPLNTTVVNNTYDDFDRVTQQVFPRQAGTATYKMHYTGFSSSEENPDGTRTTYIFNTDGRTIATEDALGNKTSTRFDGQGQQIGFTDPLGNETDQQFDSNNNLIKRIDANHDEVNFEYDTQHRLIKTTDALNHSSETDYDVEHHPIRVRDALNNEVETSFRADGLPSVSTNARDVITALTYDANGYISTKQTGTQPAVTSNYDTLGRLTSLTDPAGATTSFVYDDRGLVTARTDALNKTTTSMYNAQGLLTSQTDRNGDTTTLTYTPTDKLNTISYPARTGAPGFTVSYTYDSRDRLTQTSDQLGDTVNTYDALDRLITHTNPNSHSVGYAYDAAGNITEITYPDGKTVSYQYDSLNRISNVSIDWLNVNATPGYDSAGRLTGISHFNDTSTTYGYDVADRLIRITHYRGTNQILGDYRYILDANGNRTRTMINAEPILPTGMINTVRSQTYNTQKNRILTAMTTEPVSLTYDNEGQISGLTGTTINTDYVYDAAHRVIGYSTSSEINTYQYDGAGNRLIASRNGAVQQYIYDAAGNLLAVADDQGVIQRYYIHGLGLMAMIDASSSEIYVYHFDGTGHTVAITDANADITHRYAYSAYGRILAEQEAIPQPFKYAGQVGIMHETEDVYYMRARYYDAQLQQFISEDPAGFADGPNLYAYAGGNPITYVDPTGEAANLITGLIGGVTGAVVGGAKNLIQQHATGQDFQPISFLADVVAGGVGGGCLGATGNVYGCSTLAIQLSLAGTVGQAALDNKLNSIEAPSVNNIQSLSRQSGLPASSFGK